MGTLAAALDDHRAKAGAVLLAIFVGVALLAPWIAPYAPNAMRFDSWLRPSVEHLLGTTSLGQDVFSQLVWGTRLTLIVGLVTGLVATVISVVIGLTAAFFRGITDESLSILTNVILVLPGLPLILIFAAFVKLQGVLPIILVIAFTGWAWGARVLRSQALSLRERDFVQAAIASGEGPANVIFAHVLPNMAGLIAANFFGAALYAVLAQASLEFLGIGNVSLVSWGTMLYWAQTNQALLRDAWYWIAAPGLCIAGLGMSFALLNFGMDAVGNPSLRRIRRPTETLVRSDRRASAPREATDALLSIRDLEVGYRTASGTVRAVKGVSLEVGRGQLLGIAGESGCGKSTLAFAVARLLQPPGEVLGGEAVLDGRDLLAMPAQELRRARWRDFSIVFQASMNALNPVLRVREQVHDVLEAHGLRDAEAREERAEELFRLVGLRSDHLSAYPHQLSGGMKQRVVIAIALALDPKLLIMDEPTTALDVVVQRALLQEIDELRRRLDLSIVFITHDLSLLVEMSDRVAIMYAGEIVEEAPAAELYARPLHPYTRRLMASFPPLYGEVERREGLPGRPPDLGGEIVGCPFAPRCPERIEGLCDRVAPAYLQVEGGRRVACHLYAPDLVPEGAHGDQRTGAAPAIGPN